MLQPPKAIGGQSAPPSLKACIHLSSSRILTIYRGAVRPPFIEGSMRMAGSVRLCQAIGGQSAPPSLKVRAVCSHYTTLGYRGAVRPPFIEGIVSKSAGLMTSCYSAPLLSGGSPPPFIEGWGGVGDFWLVF